MSDNLLVTVLIPCYNAERHLVKAVESVMTQTYRNLEILLVDDGSTDRTPVLLEDISARDKRIVVVTNSNNMGLIETLNKGILLARGSYIARMDSDDVITTTRIERQMRLIAQYPGTEMTGVLAKFITPGGRFLCFVDAFNCKTTLSALFVSMFESPIAHPGVLIETSVFRKYGYLNEEAVRHMEDYDMFSRMLRDKVRYRLWSGYELLYRMNDKGVSSANRAVQFERTKQLSRNNIRALLGLQIDERLHTVLLYLEALAIGRSEVVESLRLLTNMKARFIAKEAATITREDEHDIDAWVLQRKLRIIKTLALHGRTPADRLFSLLLLLQNIHAFIYGRTYFNMLNTAIRIVNSKIRSR